MVTVKNLKRTDKTIEADFYPENSSEAGHIVVDIASGEILSRVEARGYERRFSYTAHARQALLEFARSDELPEKHVVMWY